MGDTCLLHTDREQNAKWPLGFQQRPSSNELWFTPSGVLRGSGAPQQPVVFDTSTREV
jgi:hypothetical protein